MICNDDKLNIWSDNSLKSVEKFIVADWVLMTACAFAFHRSNSGETFKFHWSTLFFLLFIAWRLMPSAVRLVAIPLFSLMIALHFFHSLIYNHEVNYLNERQQHTNGTTKHTLKSQEQSINDCNYFNVSIPMCFDLHKNASGNVGKKGRGVNYSLSNIHRS